MPLTHKSTKKPTAQAAKKAAAAPVTPKKAESPPDDQLGEFDVALDFKLALRDRAGTIINVTGNVPLTNATTPAFLTNSQQTLTEMVTQLVQGRFLLQARHYFNQLQRAQVEPKQPELAQSKQTESRADRNVSSLTLPDSEFGFEDEEKSENDRKKNINTSDEEKDQTN